MRIGFQQTALGDVVLDKCFAIAKRAGAEGVGLCYRTSNEASYLGDTRHIAKIRTLAERMGLAVTGLHLGVLCNEPSLIGTAGQIAQSQELIRRAIATSAQLGCPDVIVPFFGRNRIELPAEFDTAGAAMSDLAASAGDHGVVLAVESTMHLNQLRELLDWCGSEFVQVCLDIGDVTACRYDPTHMIRGLEVQNIAQVHIKDVRIERNLPPDFNVRLGYGDVGFPGVANALRSVNYEGWIVLETPPGDEHGNIVASNVEFVQRFFPLRQPQESVIVDSRI
jgi:sugar phosphate isomerase/epimerase